MVSKSDISTIEGNDFFLLFAGHAKASSRTPIISNYRYRYHLVELVISGAGIVQCGEERKECNKGDIYFCPPGQDNFFWPNRKNPWEKIFFVVCGSFADQLFERYGFNDFTVLRDCMLLRNFFTDIILLHKRSEKINALLASSHVHRFLAEARLFQNERTCGRISPAEKLREVLENSREEHFRLNEYARKEGLSREYLIRHFKETYGESPYEFLQNKRMETATQLLRHTNLTVKEISYRLDFCDPGYFSTYFKRKFGSTPQKWRETHLAEQK